LEVQRPRRRGESSWWLGWVAVALEVAAGLFVISSVFVWWRFSAYAWWEFWVGAGVAYLGGGLVGAVAFIVGTGAAARGGGWKLGLAVVLYVFVTLSVLVVVVGSLLGGDR
jgi:hypothetical protein